MTLKLIRCNPEAVWDGKENHKRRMLQENCPHLMIIFKEAEFQCGLCGILFTMTFNTKTDELTFWIGEPLEEKDDDGADSA